MGRSLASEDAAGGSKERVPSAAPLVRHLTVLEPHGGAKPLASGARRLRKLASSMSSHLEETLRRRDSRSTHGDHISLRRHSRGEEICLAPSAPVRRLSAISLTPLNPGGSLGNMGSVLSWNSRGARPWRPRYLQGEKILGCMSYIVHSRWFSIGMFVLSFYVLFGDDLRLALFSMGADKMFDGITISCIVLFTFELVITIIVIKDYFLSFFFFLDVISTISLILDLTFVWGAITGQDSITQDEKIAGESAADQSDYARAGRSSRVGTRVARILRVFRLIRMARMVKILSGWRSSTLQMRRAKQVGPPIPEEAEPSEAPDDFIQSGESKVGKKLSDRTTLWVIMLVLAMLIILPLLDPGSGPDDMLTSSAQFGADVMHHAWQDFQAAGTNQSRLHWEKQVLMFTYYHNYYAECPVGAGDCASHSTAKLCFLGYVVDPDTAEGFDPKDSYIRELSPDSTDWDELFHSSDSDRLENQYVVGTLPEDIKWLLASPWQEKCTVGTSTITGVSLLRNSPCPWRTFRPQETLRYFPIAQNQDASKVQLLVLFDTSRRSALEAVMSILRTVFTIIALAMGALFVSRDADTLVLQPIERMISKVELIRKNPLYAIKLGDEQNLEQYRQDTSAQSAWQPVMGCGNALLALVFGRPERSATRGPTLRRSRRRMSLAGAPHKPPQDKKMNLETKILENTIIKLGYLLALGFGEAGTEIIGHNLHDNRGGVDATIPGRKVEAIYGYCQIKDFSITTEVLQEKTMVFVNQVAEIVHRIVDEHLGAANKNVGEAFLLVWRVGLYEEQLREKIADLSVASFIQVMVAVTRNRQLAEYSSHPALLARCNTYRVNLGFGLHLGWAIEGAIGSEFKIEASYLSSHVNTAMFLETLTNYFNVKMLVSEALARACSKIFAYYFRVVDNMKLKGLKAPTRLFTIDLDLKVLVVDTSEKPRRQDQRQAANRHRDRQQREGLKLEKLDNNYCVHEIFSMDKHIKRMRVAYPLEFFQEFEKGYVNYESGEWDVASSLFERTAGMIQGIQDGPSMTLLEYMRSFDFKAPARWPGYRDFDNRPITEMMALHLPFASRSD